MKVRETKPCNRCDIGRAKLDERYCPRCREIVRKEMESTGYLTPHATRQVSEQRANATETRLVVVLRWEAMVTNE